MRLAVRWLPATALILVAMPLRAQSHPDLTGTWILDPAKTSVDGQIPAPASATYTITMHGDTMTVDQQTTNEMGAMATKKVWAADGKAWPSVMTYGGNDMQLSSVLTWKENVLNVQTTTDYQGTPVQQSETWTPSSDGKMLTVGVTTNVDGSYFAAMTMVFNKK
jgi:hypothetical protein